MLRPWDKGGCGFGRFLLESCLYLHSYPYPVQALHGRAPSHFRLRVEQGTHALRERTRLEPLVDRLMSISDKVKVWSLMMLEDEMEMVVGMSVR